MTQHRKLKNKQHGHIKGWDLDPANMFYPIFVLNEFMNLKSAFGILLL